MTLNETMQKADQIRVALMRQSEALSSVINEVGEFGDSPDPDAHDDLSLAQVKIDEAIDAIWTRLKAVPGVVPTRTP